jgi:hypothetical protein
MDQAHDCLHEHRFLDLGSKLDNWSGQKNLVEVIVKCVVDRLYNVVLR